MIESFSFLLNVIAKDLYAIFTSIEPQQILDLSVCNGGIRTESTGNVVVDFSCVRV